MNRIFLVGINKYDPLVFGTTSNLKGCINDIRNASDFLPDGESRILLDIQAKKQLILHTLETYALECVPGDIFYYYHSSHGTYFDAKDGRHTGRVAYDGVIWDNEMAAALAKFQKGVTVVTFSDCCYSHSNSRNAVPPEEGARRKVIELSRSAAAENVPPAIIKMKYAATIYHLAACQSNEVAWEIGENGKFTKTLDRVIFSYKPLGSDKKTNITTLFKALQKSIIGQTPTMEKINASKAAVPKI